MKKTRLITIMIMSIMVMILLVGAGGSASAEYGATEMTLNVATATSFNDNSNRTLLSFSPTKTGYYVFSDATEWADSNQGHDMEIYIYDETLYPIMAQQAKDGFACVVKLEAEKTYYFTAFFSWESDYESTHKVKISEYTKAIYAESKQSYYLSSPASQTDLEALAEQTSEAEPSYQWYRIAEGENGEEERILLEGETGETLLVQYAPEITDYVCVITAGNQVTEVKRTVVPDIWMNVRPLTPEKVTIQNGEQTTMQIVADINGYKPRLQWYKRQGMEATEIEGATGTSYTTGEPGRYSIELYDDRYPAMSRGYDFTVFIDNEFSAEAKGEAYQVAMPGQQISFEVEATCKTGVPTYQWFKYYMDNNAPQKIDNATEDNYTFTANEDCYYFCSVTDQYGNEALVHFSVYIEDEESFTVEHIGEDYIDATGKESFDMEVAASDAGGAEITYQWYGRQAFAYIPITGATQAKYTETNPGRFTDYCCAASNGSEEKECYFYVRMESRFTARADGQSEWTVTTGEEVTMKVTASITGDGEGTGNTDGLTYRWYKKGYGPETTKRVGENLNQLKVTADATEADYTCVVSDGHTEANINFTIHTVKPASNLKVTADGETTIDATPITKPTLKVNVTGATGTPQYKWYRVDENAAANKKSYTPLAGTTESITADRSGDYLCVVTDDSRAMESAIFKVRINSGLSAYVAGDGWFYKNVIIGETTTLGVTAMSDSDRTISYQWYVGDSGGYSACAIPGAVNQDYTTTPIWKRCYYQCRVDDGYSTRTVEFTINVDNQLTVTTETGTEIGAKLNEEIQLKVNASCRYGKLYYSWRLSEYSATNGYTSTYLGVNTDTLTITATEEQRTYTCEIHDEYNGFILVDFTVSVCHEEWPEPQITTNLTEEDDGTYSIEAGKPITVRLENADAYNNIEEADIWAEIDSERNGMMSCNLIENREGRLSTYNLQTGKNYILRIKVLNRNNNTSDRIIIIPFHITETTLPENGVKIGVSSNEVMTGETYSVWVYAPGASRTEIRYKDEFDNWLFQGSNDISYYQWSPGQITYKALAYFPDESEPRETESITVSIKAPYGRLTDQLQLQETPVIFATAGEAVTIRLNSADTEHPLIPDRIEATLIDANSGWYIWDGHAREQAEITIPAKNNDGTDLLAEGRDYTLYIYAYKIGYNNNISWYRLLTTNDKNTATIRLMINDSDEDQEIACGESFYARAEFPRGTTQYQIWNGESWHGSGWLEPGSGKVRMNMGLTYWGLPVEKTELIARYTTDPEENVYTGMTWNYTKAVRVSFTCDHSETITEYEWNSDHKCTEDNEQTHTHTGTGKKVLRCTRCRKKIRDLEDVEGPITEKHTYGGDICNACGYKCLHEGIEVYEPKTTYEKCDSQYHYRYVNRGSYLVQCPHCNYSEWYGEESSMELHTDGDDNQICDLCGGVMAGNWDWQIWDGDLIFSGTGTIPAFTSAEATPWYKDAAGIRRIILEEGISGIGAYAFAGFGDKTIRVDFTQSKLTDLTIDPDAFNGTDAICRYYSEDNSWPASKTTTSNYGGTQKWFYLSRRNVNNAISNIEYGANGSWRMDLYEYGQYESIDDTELMIELTFPERRVYLNAIPTAAADKAVYEDNLDTTGQIAYAEGCTGSTILTLTEDTKDDFAVFFEAPALTATINTGDCGHSIRMAYVREGSQITINGDVENLTLGSMETMGLLDTGNSSANVMINGDITALNYYSKYNKSTEAGFKANLTVNGTIKEGHVYGRTTLTVPNINPNGEGANKDTVPIGDTMVIRFKNVKQTGKIITDSEVTVADTDPIAQYTPDNCDLQYNYDKELGYWMLRVTPLDLEMGGDFSSSFVNISQYNPNFSLNDVYWGRSTGLVLGDMGTADAPVELNAPEGKKIGFLQLMSDECHVKLNCPAQEILIGGDRNYTGKYSLEINNQVEDLRIEIKHGDEVAVTSGANGSVRYGYYSIPMRRTRYYGPTSGAGTLFSNGKLQIMSWLPGERLRAILPSDDEVTEAAGLGTNSIAVLEAEDAYITFEQEQNDALAAIGATPDDVEQVFELYVKEYGLNENGSIDYEIGTIQELAKPIEVAVTNGTGTRVAVVRMHEETDQETGEVTVRAAQITPFTNNRKISFESDRFSTYLLISEPEGEEINPSTLTKVITLPASVKRIEENAFEGIDAEAIIVPAGCEYIGDRAFANCPNLVYVTGPESATLAGDPFAGSNVKVYDTYKGKQD